MEKNLLFCFFNTRKEKEKRKKSHLCFFKKSAGYPLSLKEETRTQKTSKQSKQKIGKNLEKQKNGSDRFIVVVAIVVVWRKKRTEEKLKTKKGLFFSFSIKSKLCPRRNRRPARDHDHPVCHEEAQRRVKLALLDALLVDEEAPVADRRVAVEDDVAEDAVIADARDGQRGGRRRMGR